MVKYILVTHVWSDGPSQALKEYFIKKKKEFVWIEHPLYYSDKIGGSKAISFSNGVEVSRNEYNKKRKNEILKYLGEIIFNIRIIAKSGDYSGCNYIGYNNLNTLSGIILKKLGKISKVFYYVVDYTPKRFDNKILNFIYHKIDQFCVMKADETWNLNEKAMNNARKNFYNFDSYRTGYSIQKEIPMGFWSDRIKIREFKSINNKKQIVFIGSLLEKQGIQFVIKALSIVKKTIPDIKFTIIGDGEYRNTLELLVDELKLRKNVKFTGFLEKLTDAEKIMTDSSLAVALYERGNYEKNFSYYTDQGKIKNYLGAGLVTLLSDVPPIAKELEKNKCGIIIDNDPKNIAKAVIELLSDEKKLKLYRDNVIKYRNQFDWNVILKKMNL